MTPAPVYTFLVNNIDYSDIYSRTLPQSIENIILNLNNQAVYVPYVNKPLKNGDIFTLYGKKAEVVYDMFIGASPRMLELLAETDRVPTLINKDLKFDILSYPVKSAFSNIYIATICNYSGQKASFVLKCFDSAGTSVLVTLLQDGVLNENSPNNSFNISINNSSIINLTLNGIDNFYYTYDQLSFEGVT